VEQSLIFNKQMSKHHKDNLQETQTPLASSGKFMQENAKSLAVIGGAILALIVLYFGYQKFYLAPRAEKAANEMFRAEQYAASDSLADKAIKGDGSYPGFEVIADEYSNTKSANIANAYLGGLYLKKGEFQKAADALGEYSSTGSPVIDPLVLGMLGDAYSELKDYRQAITYYKKASDKSKNTFTSPLYLKKLGLVYEEQKEFKAAEDAYQKIKTDYPESNEASVIDSYIARAQARQ
jgi:tetratricopeptide (TPR) repeat protein